MLAYISIDWPRRRAGYASARPERQIIGDGIGTKDLKDFNDVFFNIDIIFYIFISNDQCKII